MIDNDESFESRDGVTTPEHVEAKSALSGWVEEADSRQELAVASPEQVAASPSDDSPVEAVGVAVSRIISAARSKYNIIALSIIALVAITKLSTPSEATWEGTVMATVLAGCILTLTLATVFVLPKRRSLQKP